MSPAPREGNVCHVIAAAKGHRGAYRRYFRGDNYGYGGIRYSMIKRLLGLYL